MLMGGLLTVAPATGTPETGGWSTRELRTILRGLDGLNLVGADVVEVAVSNCLQIQCAGVSFTNGCN